MNLADFLIYLRQQLIVVRENKDVDEAHHLKTVFGTLVEASYQTDNATITTLLVAFEDASRDCIMSVPWKSDIPSENDIRVAFQ